MDNLENIAGNLCDAYALIDPETMLHNDEIQHERLTNFDFRYFTFYPADGCLYRMHKGKAQLGMTRREHNLVLRHIDDAFTQLVETGNYHPSREEADAAFAAESTLCVNLNQLRLQGTDEWSYFSFSPQGYDILNPEERKLAERVHGTGDTFIQVMKILQEADIQETQIFVLNPSYVKAQTKKGSIGLASWLSDFILDSCFYANDSISDGNGRVRGVLRHPVASVAPVELVRNITDVISARDNVTILRRS